MSPWGRAENGAHPPPPLLLSLDTVSGGALHMQRKIWAAADFQNFLARSNSRRPRKNEVRKRRASIYRTSPSDAVEHFLVSHVTGWAIWGHPGLELDTGIFPFVPFLDTVLPRSSNLSLKKNVIPGKRAWCKAFESCLVFVWQLECLNGNGPLRLFTGGTSRRSEKLRTLSHFHTVDPCKKAVFACLAR